MRNSPSPPTLASIPKNTFNGSYPRKMQLEQSGEPNAQLRSALVREHCKLVPALRHFLEDVPQRMGLSPRPCQRILKVSRTIADLDGSGAIGDAHLAEALAYRGMDGGKPTT